MVMLHKNGGFIEPVRLRYLGIEVVGTPILMDDGAPIVNKTRPNDAMPSSQAFEIDVPPNYGSGKRCVLMHAVLDPVAGGLWIQPGKTTPKMRLQELWARPGPDAEHIGHIFHWPIEDTQDEQCVSRTVQSGNGPAQDMYKDEMGCVPVTKEQLVARIKEAAVNFKNSQEEAKARDPRAHTKLLADTISENTKAVIAGSLQMMREQFANQPQAKR